MWRAEESYGKLVAYLRGTSSPRRAGVREDARSPTLSPPQFVAWPSARRALEPGRPWAGESGAATLLIDAASARRRSADLGRSEAAQLIDAELKEASDAHEGSPIGASRLRVPACAHPAIEESHPRAALMLQTILGLDAAAIASAFSGSLLGQKRRSGPQRLSRAKGGAPNSPRRRAASKSTSARICLIDSAWRWRRSTPRFPHGWAEAFSDDPRGRNLAEEAIWLGRVSRFPPPRTSPESLWGYWR